MPYSKEKCLEIIESVNLIGKEETAKKLGVSIPTISAALRYARSKYIEQKHKDFNPNATLKKIQEIYSEKELQAIASNPSNVYLDSTFQKLKDTLAQLSKSC